MDCFIACERTNVTTGYRQRIFLLQEAEILQYAVGGTVRILYCCLVKVLENPGQMRLLHRKRVTAKCVPSFPFSKHPSEVDALGSEKQSILKAVFGRSIIEDNEGKRLLISPQSPLVPASVPIEIERSNPALEEIFPEKLPNDWDRNNDPKPFTMWNVKGIDKPGYHVVTIEVELQTKPRSQHEAMGRTSTIDGPMSLMSRLEHCECPYLPETIRQPYMAELGHFADYTLTGHQWDVVLLNSPSEGTFHPIYESEIFRCDDLGCDASIAVHYRSTSPQYRLGIELKQSAVQKSKSEQHAALH